MKEIQNNVTEVMKSVTEVNAFFVLMIVMIREGRLTAGIVQKNTLYGTQCIYLF